MKTLLRLILLILLAITGILYGHLSLERWAESKVVFVDSRSVQLEKGQSLKSFSRHLYHHGLITSPLLFEYWVKIYDHYNLFQAGMYLFKESVSPIEISAQIKSGKIHIPIELSLVIPEGSSIKNVCLKLEEKKIAKLSECLEILSSKELLTQYNLEGLNFEGYLYPATYSFSKIPNIEEVLNQMLSTFKLNIAQHEDSLAERGLSLYQGLIFASLIEKEVASFKEYSKVSEVIWARLQTKMALGIDAALIYGLKNFDGDITFAHLKDLENPYNLRLHAGLPPTPICSPSKAAVLAVLNPTADGYLYYVKKPGPKKVHHFSKNLAEHNLYVKKLVTYERSSNRLPTQ